MITNGITPDHPRPPKAIADRFWRLVDWAEPAHCWKWKGRTEGGVPIYRVRKGRSGTQMARRIAWLLTKGPVPEGRCILLACQTPLCMNPSHFILGIQRSAKRQVAL